MPNTLLKGFEPLTREFTPVHHGLKITNEEAWQQQATANIIISILTNVYGCSDLPKVTFWIKSATKTMIKTDIPMEYPDNLNQASKDRLSVERFIGDMRHLKLDTDEILFFQDGTPSNPPLMSFNIRAIMPYLKIIAKDTNNGIIEAIDQVMSAYEKSDNRSNPKYNI